MYKYTILFMVKLIFLNLGIAKYTVRWYTDGANVNYSILHSTDITRIGVLVISIT